MDGTLLLAGYKLKQKLYLNLQKHTLLITHSDYYTPVIIFDLLERYFTKKDFSDKYLREGIKIKLNNDNLVPSDYIVYRLKPIIDLEAEIKIVKKTILGQLLEQQYRDKEEVFENITKTMNIELLPEINAMLETYGIKVCCMEQNIFNFSKILSFDSYLGSEEIFFKEHSPYKAKMLLLDMLCKLKTDKPKLLLIELPEYGLDSCEIKSFFSALMQVKEIENMIIYTNSKEVLQYIRDIYSYHLIRDGSILGFDDYDEMEVILADKFLGTRSEAQLLDDLLTAIFAESEYNEKFGDIDKIFRLHD